MQHPVQVSGMGQVIAVQGVADVLADHLLDGLRPFSQVHDIVSHERGIELGQMLMLGKGRNFLTGEACHVFDIIQRDHPLMIARAKVPCLTWINAKSCNRT